MLFKHLYFKHSFLSQILTHQFLFLSCLFFLLWKAPAYGSAADVWDGSVDTGWYQGTSSGVTSYTIKKASELAGLARLVNNGNSMAKVRFYLDGDLQLNDPSLFSADENGNLQVRGSLRSWTPIGNEETYFQGSFYGNGHEITGLFIHNSSKKLDSAGLFGNTLMAEISDLTLNHVWIYEESKIGGFVGNAYRTVMKNCTVSDAFIKGRDKQIGGLAGWVSQNSHFEDCTNYAFVKGKSEIGGIAAKSVLSIYRNCQNYGRIVAESDSGASKTGGIAGYSEQDTMEQCSNHNTITGMDETGGLAGVFKINACIRDCYNTGAIAGREKTGGLFGMTGDGVRMQYCYSAGEVQGTKGTAGALIGKMETAPEFPAIQKCYYRDTGIPGAGNTVYEIGEQKKEESFTGGEVAYLLDMEEGEHRSVWSMGIEGSRHPVLKTTDMQVIHRICFLYHAPDGKSQAAGNYFYKYTNEHGALAEIPSVPYREGFLGIWSESSFERIREDKTVVAVYMPVYLQVTFQIEGQPDTIRKVPYGSALLLFPEIPEKTGYLGEWNVSRETFLYITKDITAKAVYRPIRYRIVFDGNGNSGGTMREIECMYNTKSSLPANRYYKENALFLGWNTEKNGTGEYFGDRAEIENLSAREGDRIYLYAVWKDAAVLQNTLQDTLSVSVGKMLFTKNESAAQKTILWKQKTAAIKKIKRCYPVRGGNAGQKQIRAKGKKDKEKKAKNTKKELWKVFLKKVKGAAGYQIACRYGKNGKIKKQKSKKEQCLLEKKKGKNFYIRVRAYKKINGKKVYTKFSKWIKIAQAAGI